MADMNENPAELARILSIRVWACRTDYLRTVSRLAREGPLAAEGLRMAVRPPRQLAEGVMVLPIYGLITQRGGYYGCGTQEVWQCLSAALVDPAVTAIVLEHDSPGGEVYGVEELAVKIREARGTKPIVSHVNSLSASASYYIASQADEVVITPSGEAGSVGVYTVHEDWSGALDQMGVKVEFISAGEGKVDGNPYAPLSDEARADMQAQVDRYYAMFVAAVAKGRKVGAAKIKGEWQAKVWGAKECVSMGLADSVGTLEVAIARAAQLGRKRKAPAAAGPALIPLAVEEPRAEPAEEHPAPLAADVPAAPDVDAGRAAIEAAVDLEVEGRIRGL